MMTDINAQLAEFVAAHQKESDEVRAYRRACECHKSTISNQIQRLNERDAEIARLQRELEEARHELARREGEILTIANGDRLHEDASENAHLAADYRDTLKRIAVNAKAERSLLRGLLERAQPWVERGLNDHPAPTSDDLALLAEIAQALGKADHA